MSLLDREVWFTRRRFIGYVPANWKGRTLTLVFFTFFFLYFGGALALGLIEKYGDWLFVGFYFLVFMPLFFLTIRHMDHDV